MCNPKRQDQLVSTHANTLSSGSERTDTRRRSTGIQKHEFIQPEEVRPIHCRALVPSRAREELPRALAAPGAWRLHIGDSPGLSTSTTEIGIEHFNLQREIVLNSGAPVKCCQCPAVMVKADLDPPKVVTKVQCCPHADTSTCARCLPLTSVDL